MLTPGPISDQVKLLQAGAKMALDKSAVQSVEGSTVSVDGKLLTEYNTLTSKDGVTSPLSVSPAAQDK